MAGAAHIIKFLVGVLDVILSAMRWVTYVTGILKFFGIPALGFSLCVFYVEDLLNVAIKNYFRFVLCSRGYL